MSVLLLLGHGSSKHPDSSASVRAHTRALEQSGEFEEVRCAFLKEEPLVDHCLDGLEDRQVTIVPDFLAEGYFTRQVIPSKLSGHPVWKKAHCCPPVGTHPVMADLIDRAATDLLESWQAQDTSLLVVGHGSGKNPCSKQTLRHHLHTVRGFKRWGQVADLWLEEPPRVGEWMQVASKQQVIVVPFLLNDGQHGGWDIPDELGIASSAMSHGVTHELGKHQLRLSPALGCSARFADAIAQFARIWASGD